MKYISNLTELQFTVPNDIKTVLTVPFSELRKIMADASLSKIEEFLYSIDKYLESKKQNIIITYVALDILLDKSYRGRVIAALISLWFDYLSRFKRIRVKIFLRNDIFKNEVKEGITDKVKLRNY